jgi:C-terminal processing protease CtpA/Prc
VTRPLVAAALWFLAVGVVAQEPVAPAPGPSPAAPATTSRWARVDAALALLEQRHVGIDPGDLESGLLTGLLTAADPGGRVIPASDLPALEKSCAGITANPGWKLGATNHLVVLQEPLDPARNPVLPAGWTITSLDGNPTATNAWASVARQLRRDAPGTVTLGLTDPLKGVTTNLTVQLALTPEPPVALRETFLGDVRYVRLNGLYPRSAPEVQAALKPDPDLRGLILDLRDAGGEDVDAVLAAAALFCGPDKVLAQWKGLDDSGASDLRSAPWVGPGIETPVLVLINARTRGASELFAALIARCGRGVLLVGEPAAGDPLLRESIPVDDGPVLRVATRKLVFAQGPALDARTTLTPDVRVGDADLVEPPAVDDRPLLAQNHLRAADTAAHAAGVFLQNRIRHDAVLKRAVDIMLGLRALPPKSR